MSILRMLLVVFVIGAAGRANAAENDPVDVETEDQLTQGIALRRSGNDEAALALFLDLEKRAPDSVRLLLHIATAAQATGKWIMAYDYLQKASNHKDDPYFQRHRAAIDNVERTIDQRVGQFRAHGSPSGAEVRLSGELIGTLPLTVVKPVAVGSYVLEVSKQGYFPLRRPVTVAGGLALTQEAVELREQRPLLASGLGQTALQGEAAADTGPAQPTAWWRARWITWSLAGAAAAAAATSGVAFAIRERNAAKWNDNAQCLNPNMVNENRGQHCASVRQDIRLDDGIGIGASIAAVAFAGAALTHWLATSHDHALEPAPLPRPQADVRCSPALAGILCSGSF
jgi:PEGA domain-containing protein